MKSSLAPFIRFILAGRLQREFIVLPSGKMVLDTLGGNLLYAAAGLMLWGSDVGLISRVGNDFPQEWLDKIADQNLNTQGIFQTNSPLDVRRFIAYPDFDNPKLDNPVSHFARLEQSMPRSLLGYTNRLAEMDSRTTATDYTLRSGEVPEDYLDATAAHICPVDYLTHTAIPSLLRQAQIQTVTLDTSPTYMTPVFWDNIPAVASSLTALHTDEDQLTTLFSGRTHDLWEMAEAISAFGCEMVTIRRKGNTVYLYENAGRNRWIIPAYPARLTDPTGSGDAFCGGFLACYRETYDPLEAALHGAISTSMVVEGSQPFYALNALPGLAQARLDSLRPRVQRP